MLNHAQADAVKAKVASDERVHNALQGQAAPGAPMTPRLATFAAAYLIGVADGSTSEHELGWLHHFLDRLEPLKGTDALTEADLEKVTVNIILARKKYDGFIASIAASLPEKSQRAGALYLACIISYLDGVVYESEQKHLDALAQGLGLAKQEQKAIMETANELVISLGRAG
jgi:tellurite resistance protein